MFDQNPSGGDHASKGDQVLIVVSTGKPKVEVPDVRQKSLTDAVQALTEAGLKYHAVEVPSSLDPGTVTAQFTYRTLGPWKVLDQAVLPVDGHPESDLRVAVLDPRLER